MTLRVGHLDYKSVAILYQELHNATAASETQLGVESKASRSERSSRLLPAFNELTVTKIEDSSYQVLRRLTEPVS